MTNTIQKLVNTKTLFNAVTAALILTALPCGSNAEGWELRTVQDEVPGTREIESGKIDKAIRISLVQLPHAAQFDKVAVLTNLCIAYILSNDMEKAEDYCDQAVAKPNETAVTHNNRGILRMLQGEYSPAMDDFTVAVGTGCTGPCSESSSVRQDLPRSVARRNINKAAAKVARLRENQGTKTVATRSK